MKKVLSLGLVALFSVSLAACGGGGNDSAANETKTESTEKSSDVSVSTEKSTTESSKKESTGDFVENAADATFDGKVLKGNSYTIKITDYKVIPVGEAGNEYGEKPVIAFWYDTLVNQNYDNSTPIDPSTAWIMNFKAVQDNDPNAVNELNVAMLPDEKFTDSQSAQIKPGGTVSMAMAYELTDEETPVTLIAGDILGKKFGKADFPVK